MPSVVTKYAGSIHSVGSWDPTNFTVALLGAAGAPYAQGSNYGNGYVDNFGFALPSNATITNLRLEGKGYCEDGSVILGLGLASDSVGATTSAISNTVFYKDYGAGAVPTVSTLNSVNFQVRAYLDNRIKNAWLDYISLTVTYTQPPLTTVASSASLETFPVRTNLVRMTTSSSSTSSSAPSVRLMSLHRPYFSETMVRHYGVRVLEQDQ